MPKKILANFLLLLSSVIFVLALLETGLRATDYPTIPRYKMRHAAAATFHLPEREFDIVPPEKNPEFFPHIRTNSVGMLDKDYTETREKNAIRGVVLGDSFCAAIEVLQKENFHTILEDSLTISGKKVEFLNFGVRAIGLTQEMQIFNSIAHKFHPDFVLLSIYLHNDMDDNADFYRKEYPDPLVEGSHLNIPLEKKFSYYRKMVNFVLFEYTKTYPFLNTQFSILENRVFALSEKFFPGRKGVEEPNNSPKKWTRELIMKLTEKFRSYHPETKENLFASVPQTEEERKFVHSFMKKYYEEEVREKRIPIPEKPGYHKSLVKKEPLLVELMLLRKFHEQLQSRNIKLYVFYFDHKSKLLHPNKAGNYKTYKTFWILERFLQERGIPYFNLMGAFAEQPEGSLSSFYYQRDAHWNSEGHRYVAHRLKDFLTPLLGKDFSNR